MSGTCRTDARKAIDPLGTDMSVIIRNETGGDVYFGAGSAKKIVPDRAVTTISDDEWATVAMSKRGSGGIRCLWPVEADSIETRTVLDYYIFAATNQIRYMGIGEQDALTSGPVWLVKRFGHVDLGSAGNPDVRINDIQALVDVAWDDRATLGWS